MKMIFTQKDKEALLRNKYVLRCTPFGVTYTLAFKKHAVEQWHKGVRAEDIFKNAGIDISMRNKYYARTMLKSWRNNNIHLLEKNIKYTKKQRLRLKENENVKNCTPKHIRYTSSFKQKAVEEYTKGSTVYDIFNMTGFGFMNFPQEYMRNSLNNWCANIPKVSTHTSNDKQKEVSKNQSPEEKIKRLELEVQYLKEVNLVLTQNKR